LIVDGRLAFVGGIGLTDEFSGDRDKGPPWRDQVVEISGPVIADWEEAFWRTWQRCGGGTPPPANDALAAEREARTLGAAETAEDAQDRLGALGCVALSEAAPGSVIAKDVVRRIGSARERAWIMSAYFVPSRRFRKALRRTARRGVDVRLLVPGPRTDH